jgi:hypothetical protein
VNLVAREVRRTHASVRALHLLALHAAGDHPEQRQRGARTPHTRDDIALRSKTALQVVEQRSLAAREQQPQHTGCFVVRGTDRADACHMRALYLAGLLVTTRAHAEVSVGAQVGAGAQGASTYSAVELRLDAQFSHGHVGLGARSIWDDGDFRDSEWATRWSALRIVRDAEVHGSVGDTQLAAAAGTLAPAYVGRIVDGYRVALDDRWRTGVRLALQSSELDAGAEIDDVLDTRLVAGGVRWLVARPWGVHASVAIDPGQAAAGELGGFHRWEEKRARLDTGASLIAEPSPTGVAFASAEIERARVRWTARGDVRYGTGGLVGPLYRVEGIDGDTGLGAGLALGAASEYGWLELGARRRPVGALYTASAGAPMGRFVQAAAWVAVTRDAAAGAGELRVVWSKRLFSALHGARMYRMQEMEMTPVWSVTAWFGAASL